MGFLKVGTPLNWEKVNKIKPVIRLYGLLQFIHIFNCNKNREDANLMFGDEIEYIILKNDETTKESSLVLCASDLIDAMMNLETNSECLYGSHWTPEYASYIIEGTPAMPFKFDLDSSAFVEDCIRNRRAKLNNFLSFLNGVRAVTLPCFPNILLENSCFMTKQITAEAGQRLFKNPGFPIAATSSRTEVRKECSDVSKTGNYAEQYTKKEETTKNGAEVVTSTKDIDYKEFSLHKPTKTKHKWASTNCGKNSATEWEDLSSHLSTFCMVEMEENKSTSVIYSESALQKGEDKCLQGKCEEQKYKKIVTDEIEIETEEGKQMCDPNEINETVDTDKINNGQTLMMKGNALYGCEMFKPQHTTIYSNSSLVTDAIISPHPRYVTLTENIRLRRGAKVIGFNPIYKDKYTNQLSIWNDSLDATDPRLFKKKKKKYVLDEHLIWNKSSRNERAKPLPRKQINSNENTLENGTEIEKAITNKHKSLDGNKLFDQVIKTSLFSGIDDDDDHIYIYDREFIEEYSKKTENPVKGYIYMDAMCFGMGMCCQQVTMSCSTLRDAKYLYDQLAVVAPLFLALTAATPYLRGLLADTDTRWRVISNSVDCRTEEEMRYLSKPRYSGISLYISNEAPLKNNYSLYNDIDVVLDKYVYEKLKKENVDDFLARHISTLFVRDPLVVFEGSYNEKDLNTVEQVNNAKNIDSICDDTCKDANTNATKQVPNILETNKGKTKGKQPHPHTIFLEDNFNFLEEYEECVLSSNQHFESFQSTNWNSVRFKPPPISDRCFTNQSSIGWRVEFRTPDIQITDFENASVVTLIIVLSKVIIEQRLNLYIPMSLLEENLFRSAKRDAILKEKFYFRKDLRYDASNNEVEEKSIYDIFFNETNGLFNMCSTYVETKYKEGLITETAKNKIDEYIEFIKLRCSGKISTDAAYLRNFILNHPAYEQDSFINSKINYDVCKLITDIGKGLIIPLELLGVFVNPYKERIKSDIRQINESQYLNTLAYRFISGEDYTQYLLLNEHIKEEKQFKTETVDTIFEDSSDDYKKDFGKIIYQFSA